MASIRFFRHVFLALFGLTPLRDGRDLVSLFGDRIYWTHYHKCYYARRSREGNIPMTLPSHCPRYIPREVAELRPRLIVTLGSPVTQRLLDKPPLSEGEVRWDEQYEGVPCICAGFPKTGADEEFRDIRIKLKPFIPEVDTNPIPPELCKEDSLVDIRVHTDFEFKSLQYYWKMLHTAQSGPALEFPDPMYREWFHREVGPRWSRYSFVLACVSFMEDQLIPICAEIPALSHYVSEDGRGCKPRLERLLSEVLCATGLGHVLSEDLLRDIGDLRVLRNCIAHSGGRVEGVRSSRALKVKDVQLDPCGVARLSNGTCEHACNVLSRFVEAINHYSPKTEGQPSRQYGGAR
jgi:hypothetical protein